MTPAPQAGDAGEERCRSVPPPAPDPRMPHTTLFHLPSTSTSPSTSPSPSLFILGPSGTLVAAPVFGIAPFARGDEGQYAAPRKTEGVSVQSHVSRHAGRVGKANPTLLTSFGITEPPPRRSVAPRGIDRMY